MKKLDIYNPMREIFAFISYSVDPKSKESVEGYTCPDSELQALKIWCIADAWQRLAVIGESPQTIALSMMIHRKTGCKETTNFLSCADFGSSYTYVCWKTKNLADDARNDSCFAPAMIFEGQLMHITIDNSDGHRQTFTGLATTHYTNYTCQNLLLIPWDKNAESFTKNKDVESSSGIKALSS